MELSKTWQANKAGTSSWLAGMLNLPTKVDKKY